jgi:ABC-type transport system involved in multi-copper enzyme maturation permease subunit
MAALEGLRTGNESVTARLFQISAYSFREAVRGRVLYSLVGFALVMGGAAVVIEQVSIAVDKLMLMNLGLASVWLFGAILAVLAGTGLLCKEREKRTLYTLLARPLRRWEFILGKYAGVCGALLANLALISVGLLAALCYAGRSLHAADWRVLTAVYFIALQLLIACALATFFSTFASNLLSALYSFALLIAGSLYPDLHALAQPSHRVVRWLALPTTWLVPNLAGLNVTNAVVHGQEVPLALVLHGTAYALVYLGAVLSASSLVSEFRGLR